MKSEENKIEERKIIEKKERNWNEKLRKNNRKFFEVKTAMRKRKK